jgi:hypothetical protein
MRTLTLGFMTIVGISVYHAPTLPPHEVALVHLRCVALSRAGEQVGPRRIMPRHSRRRFLRLVRDARARPSKEE